MSSKSTQKKLLTKGIQQRVSKAAAVAAAAASSSKTGSKSKVKVVEAVVPSSDDDEEEDADEDDEDEDEDEELSGEEEIMTFEGDDDDDDEDDDDEDDEDEEDVDVDEKGWNKMMELLGDVDPAELGLTGEDEEDEEVDDEDQDDEDVEAEEDEDEEDSEEEEDEEQLYEDLDDEEAGDDADIVPVQRESLNNEIALERIFATIKTPTSFFDTLTMTNPKSSTEIDADNDLERELAFYKQALWAAQEAEKRFTKADLPFFRPADYFAEMIKTDAHMAILRQKLLDEQAGMKASEDARKLRDQKKFGKKVQVERLKEREKEKKEVGKRLDSLKKRRKGGEGFASTEDFDIALEDAIAGPSKKRKIVESERGGRRGGRGGREGGISRRGRDNKFGNPTTTRRPKENNFKDDGDGGERGPRGGRGGRGGGGRGGRGGSRGGGGGGARGGAKRLGKSRRV